MVFSIVTRIRGLDIVSIFPWKVGIVLFMAFPETIKNERVKEAISTIINDEFFDEIEVQIYPEDTWKEIEPMLRDSRLIVGGALQLDILTKKINIHSEDERERESAINLLKSKIEIAAKWGIKSLGLCSGPDPGPNKRKGQLEILVESLKELCEYAKDYGITLLLETFDREYDKRLLIGPISEAAEVIREVRKEYDNIGLMWDLSHAPMLDERPEDLKPYKDLVKHIHVGCAKRIENTLKDTHPTFYTPGAVNSEREVADLFVVLHEINYQGIVTLEIRPEPQQTSLEAINAAKGALIHAYTIALKRIVG